MKTIVYRQCFLSLFVAHLMLVVSCGGHTPYGIRTHYDDYKGIRRDEITVVSDHYPYEYIQAERVVIGKSDQQYYLRLGTTFPFSNNINAMRVDMDGTLRAYPVLWSKLVDVDARSYSVNYRTETLLRIQPDDLGSWASSSRLLVYFEGDYNPDPVEVGPAGKAQLQKFYENIYVNDLEGEND